MFFGFDDIWATFQLKEPYLIFMVILKSVNKIGSFLTKIQTILEVWFSGLGGTLESYNYGSLWTNF
jgi:hypothetical protein